MWRSCGKPCAVVRVGSAKRGGDRPCARFAFHAENAKGSLSLFSFAGRVYLQDRQRRGRPSARSAVRRFLSRPAARLRALTKSHLAEQISADADMSRQRSLPLSHGVREHADLPCPSPVPGLAGLRNAVVYARPPYGFVVRGLYRIGAGIDRLFAGRWIHDAGENGAALPFFGVPPSRLACLLHERPRDALDSAFHSRVVQLIDELSVDALANPGLGGNRDGVFGGHPFHTTVLIRLYAG